MPVSNSDGGYDDGYRSCPCFWGTEPSSLVQAEFAPVADLTGRVVLDAGCGEGKNSIYLARKGASVKAVDVSQIAIDNAKRAWVDHSVVEWIVGGIENLLLTRNSIDVVIAYGLFHCLNAENVVRSVAAKLKDATKVGGVHIVCAFNDRSQDLSAHPGFTPLLMSHVKLLDMYSDWRVSNSSDSDLSEVHPHNQIRHVHSLTRFVARKLK
jgi:SAM-dependent methyltransferase